MRFCSPPGAQKSYILTFSLSIPFICTTTEDLTVKRNFFEKWAWPYGRLKMPFLRFLALMFPLKNDTRSARQVFSVCQWDGGTMFYTSELKFSENSKSLSPNSRFNTLTLLKLAIWRRSKKGVLHAFSENDVLYHELSSLHVLMTEKSSKRIQQKRQEVKTEMVGICI